jgi:hypothetical protein
VGLGNAILIKTLPSLYFLISLHIPNIFLGTKNIVSSRQDYTLVCLNFMFINSKSNFQTNCIYWKFNVMNISALFIRGKGKTCFQV